MCSVNLALKGSVYNKKGQYTIKKKSMLSYMVKRNIALIKCHVRDGA